jgi:hypothetical protein
MESYGPVLIHSTMHPPSWERQGRHSEDSYSRCCIYVHTSGCGRGHVLRHGCSGDAFGGVAFEHLSLFPAYIDCRSILRVALRKGDAPLNVVSCCMLYFGFHCRNLRTMWPPKIKHVIFGYIYICVCVLYSLMAGCKHKFNWSLLGKPEAFMAQH